MAFNLTAQLNIALNSASLRAASNQLNTALNSNTQVKLGIDRNSSSGLKQIKSQIDESTNAMENFGKQSGLAAKRFAAFSVTAGAFIAFTAAAKEAVSAAIDFDFQMVKLGQVSSSSGNEIKNVASEITRLAINYGVSSKELGTVAITLKQANLSLADTKIALESLAQAALAPNFENLKDTTEGAIAIMNQFKIEAKDLGVALGSVNAVAGEFAVEAGDIIEAIRKTGGAFKAAGGNLNELIALFTSVRQTTRESAESISTGLRTIFTRIQRNDTVNALREVGISLRYTADEARALGDAKLENQFVGPYEAVKRLASGLKGLQSTDPRFSAIVEQLGGYRQISKVIPLINEFAIAQKALGVAQAGSTSLSINAGQAQDALIIKFQKLKETFLEVGRNIVNSPGFRGLVDTFISASTSVLGLIDSLKGLLPLITALAAVKLFQGAASFTKGFLSAGSDKKDKKAEGGFLKMRTGGIVPGSGSGDKVRALLEPGELVVPRNQVARQKFAQTNQPGSAGKVKKTPNIFYPTAISNAYEEIVPNPDRNKAVPGGISFSHVNPGFEAIEKVGGKKSERKVYSDLGLDLPYDWNDDWWRKPNNKYVPKDKLADYISYNDVFGTYRGKSKKSTARYNLKGYESAFKNEENAELLLAGRKKIAAAVRISKVRPYPKKAPSIFGFDIDEQASSVLQQPVKDLFIELQNQENRNRFNQAKLTGMNPQKPIDFSKAGLNPIAIENEPGKSKGRNRITSKEFAKFNFVPKALGGLVNRQRFMEGKYVGPKPLHPDLSAQEILGMAKGYKPNEQEVKRGFGRASLIHHPDRGGSNYNMGRVNSSYNYLKGGSITDWEKSVKAARTSYVDELKGMGQDKEAADFESTIPVRGKNKAKNQQSTKTTGATPEAKPKQDPNFNDYADESFAQMNARTGNSSSKARREWQFATPDAFTTPNRFDSFEAVRNASQFREKEEKSKTINASSAYSDRLKAAKAKRGYAYGGNVGRQRFAEGDRATAKPQSLEQFYATLNPKQVEELQNKIAEAKAIIARERESEKRKLENDPLKAVSFNFAGKKFRVVADDERAAKEKRLAKPKYDLSGTKSLDELLSKIPPKNSEELRAKIGRAQDKFLQTKDAKALTFAYDFGDRRGPLNIQLEKDVIKFGSIASFPWKPKTRKEKRTEELRIATERNAKKKASNIATKNLASENALAKAETTSGLSGLISSINEENQQSKFYGIARDTKVFEGSDQYKELQKKLAAVREKRRMDESQSLVGSTDYNIEDINKKIAGGKGQQNLVGRSIYTGQRILTEDQVSLGSNYRSGRSGVFVDNVGVSTNIRNATLQLNQDQFSKSGPARSDQFLPTPIPGQKLLNKESEKTGFPNESGRSAFQERLFQRSQREKLIGINEDYDNRMQLNSISALELTKPEIGIARSQKTKKGPRVKKTEGEKYNIARKQSSPAQEKTLFDEMELAKIGTYGTQEERIKNDAEKAKRFRDAASESARVKFNLNPRQQRRAIANENLADNLMSLRSKGTGKPVVSQAQAVAPIPTPAPIVNNVDTENVILKALAGKQSDFWKTIRQTTTDNNAVTKAIQSLQDQGKIVRDSNKLGFYLLAEKNKVAKTRKTKPVVSEPTTTTSTKAPIPQIPEDSFFSPYGKPKKPRAKKNTASSAQQSNFYNAQESEYQKLLDSINAQSRSKKGRRFASGGLVPGTGNSDTVPMDLPENSFVIRKSSVNKIGAANLAKQARFASGGTVPALVTPGEYIYTPEEAKKIGSSKLHRMNKYAKFARGGPIGLGRSGKFDPNNPDDIEKLKETLQEQLRYEDPNKDESLVQIEVQQNTDEIQRRAQQYTSDENARKQAETTVNTRNALVTRKTADVAATQQNVNAAAGNVASATTARDSYIDEANTQRGLVLSSRQEATRQQARITSLTAAGASATDPRLIAANNALIAATTAESTARNLQARATRNAISANNQVIVNTNALNAAVIVHTQQQGHLTRAQNAATTAVQGLEAATLKAEGSAQLLDEYQQDAAGKVLFAGKVIGETKPLSGRGSMDSALKRKEKDYEQQTGRRVGKDERETLKSNLLSEYRASAEKQLRAKSVQSGKPISELNLQATADQYTREFSEGKRKVIYDKKGNVIGDKTLGNELGGRQERKKLFGADYTQGGDLTFKGKVKDFASRAAFGAKRTDFEAGTEGDQQFKQSRGQTVANKLIGGAAVAGFVSDKMIKSAGKPEDFITPNGGGPSEPPDPSKEAAYKATIAFSGALTKGTTYAAAAGQSLAQFGPVVAGIGAGVAGLVGAIQGYSDSLEEAEKAIREQKIAVGLKNLEDIYASVASGLVEVNDATIRNIQSNQADIQKNKSEQLLADAGGNTGGFSSFLNTVSFGTLGKEGFDPKKYAASVSKSGKEDDARAVTQSTMVLNKLSSTLGKDSAKQLRASGKDITATSFEDAKPELLRKLRDENSGFGKAEISKIASTQQISIPDAEKQFLAAMKDAFESEKAKEVSLKQIETNNRTIASMALLSGAVNAAAAAADNFNERLSLNNDLFEGNAGSTKITSQADRIGMSGSNPNFSQFNAAISESSGLLGDYGQSFKAQGNAVNVASQILPEILANSAANPVSGKDPSTQIVEALRAGLKERGITGAEADKVVNSVGGKVSAEDFTKQLAEAGGDVGKATEKLLSDIKDPLVAAFKDIDAKLTEQSQAYISGLENLAKRQNQILQEFDKLAGLNSQQSSFRASEAQRSPNARYGAEESRALDVARNTQAERQMRLTGLGRGGSQDSGVIAARLKEAEKRAEKQSLALDSTPKDKQSGSAFRDAALELTKTKNEAANLKTALKNLTDQSGLLEAAQKKLASVRSEIDEKRSFGRKLLTQTPEEQDKMLRGQQIFNQVKARGGSLQGMSTEENAVLFDFLDNFGSAGKKIQEQILDANGYGASQDNLSEEKALVALHDRLYQEQINAQQLYIVSQQGLQNEYFTKLEDKNKTFYRNLEKFTQELTKNEKSVERNKEQQKLAKIEDVQKNAKPLSDIGIKTKEDFDLLNANKGKVQELANTKMEKQDLIKASSQDIKTKVERNAQGAPTNLAEIKNSLQDAGYKANQIEQILEKITTGGQSLQSARSDVGITSRESLQQKEIKQTKSLGNEKLIGVANSLASGDISSETINRALDNIKELSLGTGDLGVSAEAARANIKRLETEIRNLGGTQVGIQQNPATPSKPVGLALADGGSVFTPRGTDTVPAMLTPGEFVVNAGATKQNLPLLKSINSGETSYLSSGGQVGYYAGAGIVNSNPFSAQAKFEDTEEGKKLNKEYQINRQKSLNDAAIIKQKAENYRVQTIKPNSHDYLLNNNANILSSNVDTFDEQFAELVKGGYSIDPYDQNKSKEHYTINANDYIQSKIGIQPLIYDKKTFEYKSKEDDNNFNSGLNYFKTFKENAKEKLTTGFKSAVFFNALQGTSVLGAANSKYLTLEEFNTDFDNTKLGKKYTSVYKDGLQYIEKINSFKENKLNNNEDYLIAKKTYEDQINAAKAKIIKDKVMGGINTASQVGNSILSYVQEQKLKKSEGFNAVTGRQGTLQKSTDIDRQKRAYGGEDFKKNYIENAFYRKDIGNENLENNIGRFKKEDELYQGRRGSAADMAKIFLQRQAQAQIIVGTLGSPEKPKIPAYLESFEAFKKYKDEDEKGMMSQDSWYNPRTTAEQRKAYYERQKSKYIEDNPYVELSPVQRFDLGQKELNKVIYGQQSSISKDKLIDINSNQKSLVSSYLKLSSFDKASKLKGKDLVNLTDKYKSLVSEVGYETTDASGKPVKGKKIEFTGSIDEIYKEQIKKRGQAKDIGGDEDFIKASVDGEVNLLKLLGPNVFDNNFKKSILKNKDKNVLDTAAGIEQRMIPSFVKFGKGQFNSDTKLFDAKFGKDTASLDISNALFESVIPPNLFNTDLTGLKLTSEDRTLTASQILQKNANGLKGRKTISRFNNLSFDYTATEASEKLVAAIQKDGGLFRIMSAKNKDGNWDRSAEEILVENSSTQERFSKLIQKARGNAAAAPVGGGVLGTNVPVIPGIPKIFTAAAVAQKVGSKATQSNPKIATKTNNQIIKPNNDQLEIDSIDILNNFEELKKSAYKEKAKKSISSKDLNKIVDLDKLESEKETLYKNNLLSSSFDYYSREPNTDKFSGSTINDSFTSDPYTDKLNRYPELLAKIANFNKFGKQERGSSQYVRSIANLKSDAQSDSKAIAASVKSAKRMEAFYESLIKQNNDLLEPPTAPVPVGFDPTKFATQNSQIPLTTSPELPLDLGVDRVDPTPEQIAAARQEMDDAYASLLQDKLDNPNYRNDQLPAYERSNEASAAYYDLVNPPMTLPNGGRERVQPFSYDYSNRPKPEEGQREKQERISTKTPEQISNEEIMNRPFTTGPRSGDAILDFNQNGIRIKGNEQQEQQYSTVQSYLNSPTYRAIKIYQDSLDKIKLKQGLDIVKDPTIYPENAELSDTLYLRALDNVLGNLNPQDAITEEYKKYIQLFREQIGQRLLNPTQQFVGGGAQFASKPEVVKPKRELKEGFNPPEPGDIGTPQASKNLEAMINAGQPIVGKKSYLGIGNLDDAIMSAKTKKSKIGAFIVDNDPEAIKATESYFKRRSEYSNSSEHLKYLDDVKNGIVPNLQDPKIFEIKQDYDKQIDEILKKNKEYSDSESEYNKLIRYRSSGGLINYLAGGGVPSHSPNPNPSFFKPKGTDTVPAMLTPGEFVVNAAATAKHGDLLNSINSGRGVSNFALGGKVNYLKGGKKLTLKEEKEEIEKNSPLLGLGYDNLLQRGGLRKLNLDRFNENLEFDKKNKDARILKRENSDKNENLYIEETLLPKAASILSRIGKKNELEANSKDIGKMGEKPQTPKGIYALDQNIKDENISDFQKPNVGTSKEDSIALENVVSRIAPRGRKFDFDKNIEQDQYYENITLANQLLDLNKNYIESNRIDYDNRKNKKQQPNPFKDLPQVDTYSFKSLYNNLQSRIIDYENIEAEKQNKLNQTNYGPGIEDRKIQANPFKKSINTKDQKYTPYSTGRPSIENDDLSPSGLIFSKNYIPASIGPKDNLTKTVEIKTANSNKAQKTDVLTERFKFLEAYNELRMFQNYEEKDSDIKSNEDKYIYPGMGDIYRFIKEQNEKRSDIYTDSLSKDGFAADGYPETIYPPMISDLSDSDTEAENQKQYSLYPKVFGDLNKQIIDLKRGRRRVSADDRIAYLEQAKNKSTTQEEELKTSKVLQKYLDYRRKIGKNAWTEDRDGKVLSDTDLFLEKENIKEAYRTLINNRTIKNSPDYKDENLSGLTSQEEASKIAEATDAILKENERLGIYVRSEIVSGSGGKAIEVKGGELRKRGYEKDDANIKAVSIFGKQMKKDEEGRTGKKTGGLLTGADADNAKAQANMWARSNNPRLTNSELPYPMEEYGSGRSGELTQEAKNKPVYYNSTPYARNVDVSKPEGTNTRPVEVAKVAPKEPSKEEQEAKAKEQGVNQLRGLTQRDFSELNMSAKDYYVALTSRSPISEQDRNQLLANQATDLNFPTKDEAGKITIDRKKLSVLTGKSNPLQIFEKELNNDINDNEKRRWERVQQKAGIYYSEYESLNRSLALVFDKAANTGFSEPLFAQTDNQAKQLVEFLQKDTARNTAGPTFFSNGGNVPSYRANPNPSYFKPKGTDTVPAMLSPGEFVINAGATSQHGDLLNAINSGQDVNYSATGGKVSYLKKGKTRKELQDKAGFNPKDLKPLGPNSTRQERLANANALRRLAVANKNEALQNESMQLEKNIFGNTEAQRNGDTLQQIGEGQKRVGDEAGNSAREASIASLRQTGIGTTAIMAGPDLVDNQPEEQRREEKRQKQRRVMPLAPPKNEKRFLNKGDDKKGTISPCYGCVETQTNNTVDTFSDEQSCLSVIPSYNEGCGKPIVGGGGGGAGGGAGMAQPPSPGEQIRQEEESRLLDEARKLIFGELEVFSKGGMPKSPAKKLAKGGSVGYYSCGKNGGCGSTKTCSSCESGGPSLFNDGGLSLAPSDTIPAMLTPGEFVVNAKSSAKNASLLHDINSGKDVEGFATGGSVGYYAGGKSSGGSRASDRLSSAASKLSQAASELSNAASKISPSQTNVNPIVNSRDPSSTVEIKGSSFDKLTQVLNNGFRLEELSSVLKTEIRINQSDIGALLGAMGTFGSSVGSFSTAVDKFSSSAITFNSEFVTALTNFDTYITNLKAAAALIPTEINVRGNINTNVSVGMDALTIQIAVQQVVKDVSDEMKRMINDAINRAENGL